MPQVSICIPAYKPDFFETSLRSALAQTFTDLEIIVSDDCPDQSIKQICDKFPGHINYSRNPDPGPEKNLLRLFELARGEYIKFLFDDDILHPFCVQFLLDLLTATQDNKTTLAFSPRHIIDENNYSIELVDHFRASEGVKLINGLDFIRITAINHINLVGEFTSVLFRKKDAYDSQGSFRLFTMEEGICPALPDLSAWISLAQQGNLIVCSTPLSYFRRHEKATSNPAINPRFIAAVTYYEDVLNFALDQKLLSSSDTALARRSLIRHYDQWLGTYPQLAQRISRINSLLAA